jgi:signal transduction histidine kinase
MCLTFRVSLAMPHTDSRARPVPPQGGWIEKLEWVRVRPLLSYPLAVLLVGVGLGARLALARVFPPTGFPFLTFFPVVLLSALFCGLGPALLAAGLSTLAAVYFFMAPVRSFVFHTGGDWLVVGFFVAVLLVDCVVIEAMMRALARVRREREANACLASELEARLRELESLKRVADDSSAAKSRMMAIVGHDLRQPLHVLAVAIQTLGSAELPADERRSVLVRSQRGVRNLSRSLDMLMEAARLESDAFEPRRQRVDLEPLMAQLVDEYAPLAAERGLVFDVERVALHHTLYTDEAMLLSILRNFLGNAVKYTRKGSVRLRVDWVREGALRISVSDTGPGIPASKRDAIFEQLVRLDPSAAEGVGLGLSLVKRNAVLLGLSIVVESELGKGSTFAVDVPLHAAPTSTLPNQV